MATEFKLPELSENAKEGTVTGILVNVGDVIKADTNVFEIEAGKATVEIPCPIAGKITAINVKEGEQAKVGQVVLIIDEAASGGATAKKEKAAPKQEAAPESAPAPTAAPAAAPVAEAPKKAPAPKSAPVAAASAILTISSASVPASPSTRQFAREIGVDINEVSSSEPHGRVSAEDVKRYARQHRVAGGGGGPIAAPLPDFGRWGVIEEESLTNVRAATAQHMAVSWSNIPHVTIHDQVDITAIEALRKGAKAKADAVGTKLTLTAFLIKIMASALKIHLKFNSSLDLANNQLIYKKYVNIGIAIDTDRGLVVPVLRNADQLSVMQIAKELVTLSDRAKARKISPEDMQGGSMTITNIGAMAGTFFTPIVNYPEVAILGVGRATVQPVLVDGFFQPRQMLPLSLSFDHRVIDGADGARFLRWVSDAIQQPALIALEG